MADLQTYSWDSIYESRPSTSGSHLVDEFYVPALERSIQYDRVAGYFSSSALAVAARGVHALVENDGEMRLIVGAELYETDRPVLEALSDELTEDLDELDDERLDAQLKLLAQLLREDRLTIKVAVPRRGNWGIFHPKVGIFHGNNQNSLSFEGSVNETAGGWERNYERFKVHREWRGGQREYVQADIDTFERLWDDDHSYVEVYDLPEAIEEEIIDWKAPDSDTEVDTAIQIARGEAPPTERDKANIIADGSLAPGGLALAEQGSTITPWPHQRVVSDTLVNTYPNSFLLCDEVGLGKTIEAGLTLSRLGLTGELETGLLLVPASLTIQWQEELWEKFNIDAVRFDRNSRNEYVFFDAFGGEHEPPAILDLEIDDEERDEAWVESPIWRFLRSHQDTEQPSIIIMSWHTARLTDRWNQVAPRDSGTIRTRGDVPASCRGRDTDNREGVWDAVIVDEAHNARLGSNFYKLLERLRKHTQTYYLLTATPMQLHSGELYDLMSLLDLPGSWDRKSAFVEFFETRQALAQALSSVSEDGSGPSSDDSWSAQATLEDHFQDRLPTEKSLSDQIYQAVGEEIDVGKNEQTRAIAKQRLLDACTLAADYGEHYDGYIEVFDDAVETRDIDPFDASEDEKLKYLLYPDWKADEEWLTYSRNDRLNALDDLSEAGWRVVRDVLAESTPVDALIHRNTRDTLRKYEQVGLLDETVPDRNPEQCEIDLTDDTRDVYDRIDDYTRKFYKLAQQSEEAETRAIGFVMTTYRQRLTSSVYAISQSLQGRLEKLRTQRTIMEGKKRAAERRQSTAGQVELDALSQYDLEDVDAIDELEGDLSDMDLAEVVPNVTDEGIDLLEQEIEELESFVSELRRIDRDPKIDQLVDDLDRLDRDGHNRIIVFTQYTDTMDFIRDRLVSLHGSTVATYSGRGGEVYDPDDETWSTVGKERVKREFSSDDGHVDILVCTDSASEGLNLQECGALINYDLPWNPMRVEQRIGRIDRIGQEYDEITILNYSYKDTVETDIYDRLDARIGLFENVVGEMQPILSSVSGQIRDATLKADQGDSEAAVEAADRELSKQMTEQKGEDRVDVAESLEDVESLNPQDIIDRAKLDAWQSYRHPDIVEPGEDEYSFETPYTSSALETFLVGNQSLTEAGIEFIQLSDLKIGSSQFDEAALDGIYRLSMGQLAPSLPNREIEGTVAGSIAPAPDETAVTFSSDLADDYPSVYYLAPGNPLLIELLQALVEVSDETCRLSWFGRHRSNSATPLVGGWGRRKSLARLDYSTEVLEEVEYSKLDAWMESFLETRT